MNAKELARILESSPYWSLLGLKIRKLEEGFAELYLPFKPELEQVFSVMHGGAVASLLDAAGAVAFFKQMDLASETISTVELKINYLNPVTIDQEEITATGKVIKKGRKIGVSTIEVKNKSSEIVAIGIGTYALLPRSAG